MDQDTPKEHPRNACTLCRTKKVRCFPSEVPGVSACQRCYRSGVECELPQLKVRKRGKRLVNRIEQLEQNLRSVTAELTAKRSLESPSLPVPSGNSVVLPAAESYFRATASDAGIHSPATFSSDCDVFDLGILTEGYAETLLDEFKVMAQHFPYVLVPDLPSISHFRRERPLLLLSVLATSSWRNRPLQVALERHYLKDLAQRMIMKGQQSLDMLQSLLVQLAWRHFHLKSAYRLAASAVSIVFSLGLDVKPNEIRKFGVNFEWNKASDPPTQQSIRGAEARRAYVGCYVISTSYALSLRKAGALKYSKYLEECALSLAAESRVPSDLTIVHYLRLAHHAAEVDETFGYGDAETAQNITDERLQFYMKYFETKRENLRSSIPPELAGDKPYIHNTRFVHAYTLEVGLYNISATAISPYRMAILVDCLLSVKQILDAVVALPDRVLQNLMGFNWAKIHYVINLAMELTMGVASPSWSIESVRNIIQLETYLDLFCRRLNSQSSQIHSGADHGDWFQILAANWAALRRNYLIGLQKKGIQILDGDVPILGSGNETISEPEPDLIRNNNAPYYSTDFSSIDFMFYDWMSMPQDGNMILHQAS